MTDSATILSRANQAIAALDGYKTRLDEVQPATVQGRNRKDFVTLRDVMTVQRLESWSGESGW